MIIKGMIFLYIAVPMISYSATILKFDKQGEKTGWTYINVPAAIAEQIKSGVKKSYRVKGKIDEYSIEQIALIPMGGGDFIIPLNAAIRKGIGKRKGATVKVQLTEDKKQYELNRELMECMADEPAALDFFNTKSTSFKNYYSKWVESAKTDSTRAKRIAMAVSALANKIEFGEMLRMQRALKNF